MLLRKLEAQSRGPTSYSALWTRPTFCLSSKIGKGFLAWRRVIQRNELGCTFFSLVWWCYVWKGVGERSTVHRSRCVSTSWKQWRWRCVVDRNQTTTTAKEDKLVVLRATAAGWYPRTFDVGRSMVETRLAAKLNPNVRRRSYVGISGCCFSGGMGNPAKCYLLPSRCRAHNSGGLVVPSQRSVESQYSWHHNTVDL